MVEELDSEKFEEYSDSIQPLDYFTTARLVRAQYLMKRLTDQNIPSIMIKEWNYDPKGR